MTEPDNTHSVPSYGAPRFFFIIKDIVDSDGRTFVDAFYSVFLEDPESARFLTHQSVQDRLSPSLNHWLRSLFNQYPPSVDDKAQQTIGAVHARLGIPIHLVLQGASLLKDAIADRLIDKVDDPKELGAAIKLVGHTIDVAMQKMSAAYVGDTKRSVRSAEAYRVISLGQNLAVERETQRVALMEWIQAVSFGLLGNESHLEFARESRFGLWLRHRAVMMFEGTPELGAIERNVSILDDVVLPSAIAKKSQYLPSIVSQFRTLTDEIKFLFSALFQKLDGFENGTDPLTHVLNRRFLPTILGREVAVSMESQLPLSVLMIDIDHFKRVNDAHGHDGGDAVLCQVAQRLQDNLRPSDFMIRYGGEEFFIVLVETEISIASEIAERLRVVVSDTPLRYPDGSMETITISVGVAAFDGHPDYQYLIKSADDSLYEAKRTGRNRVVVAPMASDFIGDRLH